MRRLRNVFSNLRLDPDQLATLYRDADDREYEAEARNRRKTADRHRKIVADYFDRPGAVLDVGSASGAFLRSMVDAGWRGYGIEPSAAQCARATQLLGNDAILQQTTLESANLTADFDLVTLWDVLEHVSNPTEFLACCSDRLRPGGYLVINTPRIDSFAARILGKRWPLLLAEHLTYFTPRAISICAQKADLQVVRIESRPVTFSLGYILYRLSQHELPMSRRAERLAVALKIQSLSAPIWMGELLAVCKKIPRWPE